MVYHVNRFIVNVVKRLTPESASRYGMQWNTVRTQSIVPATSDRNLVSGTNIMFPRSEKRGNNIKVKKIKL
ncbi:hypothetical protein nublan016_42750 [Klebsiella pneumoniae]